MEENYETGQVTFKTETDVFEQVEPKHTVLHSSSNWVSESQEPCEQCSNSNSGDNGDFKEKWAIELLPGSLVETQMDEDIKPTPELLEHFTRASPRYIAGPQQKTANLLAGKKKGKRRKKSQLSIIKKFYCHICQYGTIHRHGIKSHLLKHAKDKSFECDECEYKSKHPTALRRHKLYHHIRYKGKSYECPHCDYVGHQKNYMKTHIKRKHTPQGTFNCGRCNFSTKYKYNYQMHVKSHYLVSNKSHPQQTLDTMKTQNADNGPNADQSQATDNISMTTQNNSYALSQDQKTGNVYKCDDCQYTSHIMSRVKTHSMKHSDIKPFKCKMCDFRSNHTTAVRRHERYQHSDRNIGIGSQCNKCDLSMCSTTHMTSHKAQEHNVNKCLACKYTSYDSEDYLDHIIKRHNMVNVKQRKALTRQTNPKTTANDDNQIDPLFVLDDGTSSNSENKKYQLSNSYKCNHCDYNTSNKELIILHCQTPLHEDYKHLCDQCDFVSLKLNVLEAHQLVHKAATFECMARDTVLKDQQALEDHIKTHVDDIPLHTPFMNNFEDEIQADHTETNSVVEALDFDVTRGLNIENRQTKLRVYKCMVCEFSTVIRQDLSNHLKEHSPPYNCTLCDHTTKYLSSLRRHVTMHSEDSNFKCEICDFTTSQGLYLKLHMRKHSGDKQYKCDSCPYETAYRNCIIKHVRVHTKYFQKTVAKGAERLERRIYDCDQCDFKAFTEGRVVRHRYKIHGLPLPPEFTKKCEHCDFHSKDKWKLKVHNQRSFQNTPVKCKLCDFETEYKCRLRSHVLEHPDHFVPNSNCSVPNDVGYSNAPVGLPVPPRTLSPAESAAVVHQFISNHLVDYMEWNDIPVHENPADKKRFRCPHCLFASKYKYGVRRHFQRHHIRNNKQYHCLNCLFVTSTEISLDRHTRASKSVDPLICTECQFTTFYKCELAIHSKSHDKFTCSNCQYSCNKKYTLARHIMQCNTLMSAQ